MPNLHGPESVFPKAASLPKGGPASNRRNERRHPPVDSCAGDQPQWLWRTQSPIYRRRVKRAIQRVASYRLAVHGCDHLTRGQVDAVHRLLDTNTWGSMKGR